MRYVALLRGIAPMNPAMRNENLRQVAEDLGFTEVRTVISSGNLIFDGPAAEPSELEARFEEAWPDRLGFHSTTIVRTADQLRDLVERDPFDGREATKELALEVTFLKHEPQVELDLPHAAGSGAGTVVTVHDRAVCSVVDLTGTKTPDIMRWMERTYGKAITTRTWRTVHRLVAKL